MGWPPGWPELPVEHGNLAGRQRQERGLESMKDSTGTLEYCTVRLGAVHTYTVRSFSPN